MKITYFTIVTFVLYAGLRKSDHDTILEHQNESYSTFSWQPNTQNKFQDYTLTMLLVSYMTYEEEVNLFSLYFVLYCKLLRSTIVG